VYRDPRLGRRPGIGNVKSSVLDANSVCPAGGPGSSPPVKVGRLFRGLIIRNQIRQRGFDETLARVRAAVRCAPQHKSQGFFHPALAGGPGQSVLMNLSKKKLNIFLVLLSFL